VITKERNNKYIQQNKYHRGSREGGKKAKYCPLSSCNFGKRHPKPTKTTQKLYRKKSPTKKKRKKKTKKEEESYDKKMV
jgi:hypothetical protein